MPLRAPRGQSNLAGQYQGFRAGHYFGRNLAPRPLLLIYTDEEIVETSGSIYPDYASDLGWYQLEFRRGQYKVALRHVETASFGPIIPVSETMPEEVDYVVQSLSMTDEEIESDFDAIMASLVFVPTHLKIIIDNSPSMGGQIVDGEVRWPTGNVRYSHATHLISYCETNYPDMPVSVSPISHFEEDITHIGDAGAFRWLGQVAYTLDPRTNKVFPT